MRQTCAVPTALPIYLVDPTSSQGAFAAPGTIAAAPVSHPIGTSTATYPLGAPASSRPLHSQSNALLPLCYWYGHPAMQRNPLLLERIIRRLGENINDRWDYDAEGKASGLIIDTPASFGSSKPGGKGPGHRVNILKACVDAFGGMLILRCHTWQPHLTSTSQCYYSARTRET
jgi:polyribonucleotide 5'-hydroxyl-kinase